MDLTRGIDPTLLAEFSKQSGFCPCVLIESEWPDGTVYVHSGNGSFSWDSKTWTGISAISSVQIGQEGAGMVPTEAAFNIHGTIASVLDYVDPAARNGIINMWVGATTEPGGTTLVGTPFLAFTGYIDTNQADIDPATGSAELVIGPESGPAARENAAVYHSPEDQKARHSGDTLLERVAVAAKWRATRLQFPNPG